MIKTGIAGMGWWGKVLVKSVQDSDKIRVVAGATRTRTSAEEFTKEQGMTLHDDFDALIDDPNLDAVILATPHSEHADQAIAAAAKGKHVFIEKPFTLNKADAERVVEACEKAGVHLAIGFNRRHHPSMNELRRRLQGGELGTVLHIEGTQTAPNGLFLPATSWRAKRSEMPAGGLTPMGIHLIDALIDLFGEIDEVYCVSRRMAIPNDTDDTTSMILKLKAGMTAYVGTIFATPFVYRFQVFGTKGWAQVSQPSLERFEFVPNAQGLGAGQPAAAEPEVLEFKDFDTVHAELEAFADAVEGRAPYPVTLDQAVHGVSIIEAIVRSSESNQPEKVL